MNHVTRQYDKPEAPLPPAQDCFDALDMIPRGIILDADYVSRMELDAAGRIPIYIDKRKYTLSAVFYSGRCAIRVFNVRGLNPGDANGKGPLRYSTADTMYNGVWPLASVAAEELVNRCLRNRRTDGSCMIGMQPHGGGSWLWQVQLEFMANNITTATDFGKNGLRNFKVYKSTSENRIASPGTKRASSKEDGKDAATTSKQRKHGASSS